MQGTAECQSSLSNPPGLSLWSHLELTEFTTGRKTQENHRFPFLPYSQMDTSQGSFALCASRKCFYQARKQHGEFKKSFFHRVDAVL